MNRINYCSTIVTISSAFVMVLMASLANSAPPQFFLQNRNQEPLLLNQGYFRHITCGHTMPCKWAVCMRDVEDVCQYFTNRCSCPASTTCTETGYETPEGNQLLTREFRCMPSVSIS